MLLQRYYTCVPDIVIAAAERHGCHTYALILLLHAIFAVTYACHTIRRLRFRQPYAIDTYAMMLHCRYAIIFSATRCC